ncbi:MAG TPA: sensor domain-containing diguanylate cyclase [Acidimicrobiales bacterium]|nr:sensor domain-containing diguanylate cyclase [Acidimicrobiales bacterium]
MALTLRSAVARRPAAVAAVAVAVTLAALPFDHHPFGGSTSFVPAVLATVACFDVLSAVLLAGQYVDTGDLRLLASAWAYLWSLAAMTGYGAAFPGVLAHPPLATTPSVAAYLYIAWHAGFPTLLGLAWAPWPRRWRDPTPRERRRRTLRRTTVAVVAVAALTDLGVAGLATRLPVLIHGLDTSRMTDLTAPVAAPLVLAAVVACVTGTRGRRGPEQWAAVTTLVCSCDLLLTYNSGRRYSLGWYVGRSLTVVAAALVLIAMIGEFRQLKRDAELGAVTDALTGLANRRLLDAVLEMEMGRSPTTALLALDLDGFKEVNDRLGHEAGDEVLRRAAAAWQSVIRGSDLLARVGGDEFVVALPRAGGAEAAAIADRLREVTPPGVGVSIGIAVGAAGDDPAEVLAKADREMYRVKRGGPVPTG